MNTIMDSDKVKALDELFEKLSEALKKAAFFPGFVLCTGEEKIKVIKKYIRALECLSVPPPEIDPLLADHFNLNQILGRKVWALAVAFFLY